MMNRQQQAVFHEAGHAVVIVAVGGSFKRLAVFDEDSDRDGMIEFANEFDELDLEARTMANIGGLAGERINRKRPGTVFTKTGAAPHSIDGDAGDNRNDLDIIYDDVPLELSQRKLDTHIEDCYRQAWHILQENKAVHREIVQLLLVQGFLTKVQIRKLSNRIKPYKEQKAA